MNDTTNGPGDHHPAEISALAHAHATFRKWFGDEYDIDALNAVLAVATSGRLDGDPVWLMLIGGPGNAKTETVQSLTGMGALVTSTISSEGALLSGTVKKEVAEDATGGLLRKIGDRGVLVIKDFTSIIDANGKLRPAVLAALREIYDGLWRRNIGSDGGRTLEWKGRIVVVAACTTAWDRAHDVVGAMGDRFVVLRVDSDRGRRSAGMQALMNVGREEQMRADLADAVKAVVHGAEGPPAIQPDVTERLLECACLVTQARTAVERDWQGSPSYVHALEMPTRFAKQLMQVVRGALAMGMNEGDALQLAIRMGRDSIPPMRLAIMLDLAGHAPSKAGQIIKRLQFSETTVRRELTALQMLKLVRVHQESHSYSLTEDANQELLLRWKLA